MAAYKGIDVSRYQGKIDWKQVAADGVTFAILQAGYGREISQKDPTFETNYAGAKAAGIKVGAYWYSYADTVSRAKQEAAAFLKAIEGKEFDLPLFFDQEYEKAILALTDQQRTDIVLAFTKAVTAAGYACGLYTSRSYFSDNLKSAQLAGLKIWMAEYGSELNYSGKVWAWQYSSKGKVKGITGNVDMNWGYFEAESTTAAAAAASSNLLRKGDTGDAVKLLQHRLNLTGCQLVEDGIWGSKTDTAVRNFQYKAGLTVDGIAGPLTQTALIRESILGCAAEIGAYMVKNKWHYKGNGYTAKSTFAATKKLDKPGSSCAHFVSWVLQDCGLVEAGKRISHDNGKVTGTGHLLGCQVIQAGGKTWDKLSDLRTGDVCVWASNLAIYAGNGKWYDAGGPFQANCKEKRYTNVGPISPYYDRTQPVYYLVRAKV